MIDLCCNSTCIPPRLSLLASTGLLGSLFSFLQFLASPLIGASSDIYGRKKMLVLSMVRGGIEYRW